MSENLKTIQKISKVFKIISTVIFVLAIIATVILILSLSIMLYLKDVSIEGISLTTLLADEGLSVNDAIFAMIFSIISCIGTIVISIFAKRYFANELKAGTPFTHDGAKELRRLGIIFIAIPLGIALVSGIALGIGRQFIPELSDLQYSMKLDITIGVIFIIASVIFNYGAELEKKRGYSDDYLQD